MSENERLREVIERIQNAEMPLLDMAIAADDAANDIIAYFALRSLRNADLSRQSGDGGNNGT